MTEFQQLRDKVDRVARNVRTEEEKRDVMRLFGVGTDVYYKGIAVGLTTAISHLDLK